jgi:hypothetical protein
MPKLTAVALVNDVTLQDPYPTNDKLVIKLPADPASPIYVDTEVSRAQLERLTPQMEGLEASGLIRWAVSAGEGDERSEEFGYAGLPMISWVNLSTKPWAIVAGVAGGTIEGVNLLGGQVKDNVMLGDPEDPLAWMRIDKLDANVTPSGSHLTGGYFEVELIDAGSGNPQAVTVVPATGGNPYNPAFTPAKITLESDFANAAHTWATLASVANLDGNFNAICRAVIDTGTDQIVAAHVLERSSGLLNGAGHDLTVAGVPADIDFIDDTTIIYTVPGATLPGAAGDAAVMDLRTNNKLASISALLVA